MVDKSVFSYVLRDFFFVLKKSSFFDTNHAFLTINHI